MNQYKRTIFQILLWFGIWCMIWIYSGSDLKFIHANILAFLLQIVLLFALIYFAVPRFLFQKKYGYFLLSTIPLILILAYASTLSGPQPIERPPMDRMRNGPSNIPSRFLVHLLILSISSVSAVLFETFIFAQQKEKSIALAKAELMESELKFLKMQINPHFLFNALNNIYALSVTNSEKTQEGISTLSQMLRYVIYDCERPNVPLQKELEYISHFIELFRLKSSKKFNISHSKDVKDDQIMIAPMLFVPFIENAFKHSGIEKGGDSFVKISLKSDVHSIEFMVENSLPPTPLAMDGQGGIGLQNVQKRLEILYHQKHELVIQKTNTFKVNLKVIIQ